MRTMQRGSLFCAFVCLFATVAAATGTQTNEWFLSGQSASGPPVTGAPYSGDGTTTVKLILYDGTRIERHVTARFYRDSAGRIRREQTLLGLEAVNPSSDSENVVMILDPVAGVFYSLNPGSHQALRMPTNSPALADKPATPALSGAATPNGESLGTRQIEGITTIGRRTVTTIPAGRVGNDRPIEISDERWVSPDLKVVVLSRHHDPRTGDIEYRLTNIKRVEPARNLFTVPSTYTIVDSPLPPAPLQQRQ